MVIFKYACQECIGNDQQYLFQISLVACWVPQNPGSVTLRSVEDTLWCGISAPYGRCVLHFCAKHMDDHRTPRRFWLRSRKRSFPHSQDYQERLPDRPEELYVTLLEHFQQDTDVPNDEIGLSISFLSRQIFTGILTILRRPLSAIEVVVDLGGIVVLNRGRGIV